MKFEMLKKIVKKYQLIDGERITGGLVKQIAKEQNMLVNDVITLLGIAEYNKRRILKNDAITMIINIKENSEREKIKDKIQQIFLNRDTISFDEINELEKQVKISARLIGKYLGLDRRKIYELRHRAKYARLKQYHPNAETIQEIIEPLKMKSEITKQEIIDIKATYGKTDKEMIRILRVESDNYRAIMNGNSTYLKIDLLTNQEKENIIKQIKEYKKDGRVTKDDINHIKETINATDRMIKKAYGIKNNIYNDLLNYKIKSSRIIDQKSKRKVKLLKIELKYNPQYGERYYTKKELKQIARKQGLKLEAVLLYLNNPSYYFFNNLALEKNKLGLWIGENKGISYEFWSNNIELLKKLSQQAASNICYIYGVKRDKDDLQEVAYQYITSSGFLIEKNFMFDTRLQNNLFRKRGKNGILKFLREQNKLYLYQQYEEEFGVTEQRNRIFVDNTYNPDDIVEQQSEVNISKIPIRKRHQIILSWIDKFKDTIHINRKYGLKMVADKINISSIELDKYIKEIQNIIIDNKIVKRGRNGNIIQMNGE